MRKRARNILGIGAEEVEATIEPQLIGEHFSSIAGTLGEIRSFKGRWVHPMPTTRVFRRMDIEEAWPGCREYVDWMFGILNEIAAEIALEPGMYAEGSTLAEALGAFCETLEQAKFGMADAVGTGRYTLEELAAIDERILRLQQCANRLRRFVLEEFHYSSAAH